MLENNFNGLSEMIDELGDRMKSYESDATSIRLRSDIPIYARIDGRSFSNLTKGLRRPFDERFIDLMVETTKYLVKKTHPVIGYVQSDEISLVWLSEGENSSILFDGRVQKLTSVIAAMATVAFNKYLPDFIGDELSDKMPHFDCRVFQLPSKVEAANAILWRAKDAKRNSVSMMGHHYFSHKSLHKVDTQGIIQRLEENGLDYYGQPDKFKYGTFVRRSKENRVLDDEEWSKIPEKNRPVRYHKFTRTKIITQSLDFSNLENRTEYIFG